MFLPKIVLDSEIVLLACSMFSCPRCPVTEPAIDDPRKEELLEVMPCNKNKKQARVTAMMGSRRSGQEPNELN